MRQWLLDIRNMRGKTQAEAAELVGIAQSTYACIETGTRNPSVSIAKRIAAVLGFDWTEFYDDDGESA